MRPSGVSLESIFLQLTSDNTPAASEQTEEKPNTEEKVKDGDKL
jgi:hypothetical protein